MNEPTYNAKDYVYPGGCIGCNEYVLVLKDGVSSPLTEQSGKLR